ncbi:hypothetical protein NPIL_666121 [Nephila pilipes]|uniref:Uncharacterized protein n=1 Tax=Nephila pilipes TaxID=299642 RepID=A0A8X6TWE9_NEPPI|nr:hypothetical protein NPIL_666121 [Nephila pilipes]
MSLFLVVLRKCPETQDNYNISNIGNFRVKIEALKKNIIPKQYVIDVKISTITVASVTELQNVSSVPIATFHKITRKPRKLHKSAVLAKVPTPLTSLGE